jgi:hypothetical protein
MVRDWLTTKPNAEGFLRAYKDEIDWAIVPTDTVVLDIEMKGGLDGMRDLQEFGEVLPGAITQTKSGGFHYWFRQPVGKTLTGGHHIRPGIEAKAINGSVHVPPSVGYLSIIDLGCPASLPVLPENLVAAWERSATVRTSRDGQYKAETYPMGERRARLCSMAGRLRSCGLTEPELFAALVAVRDHRCDGDGAPTDTDLLRIAKDYAQKPERSAPDTSWFPKS